jgi:hypothetical protein
MKVGVEVKHQILNPEVVDLNLTVGEIFSQSPKSTKNIEPYEQICYKFE